MAALTGDAQRQQRNVMGKKITNYTVANSITINKGALVVLNASGRITDVGANSLNFAGVAEERVTGDSTATCDVAYDIEVLIASTGLTAGNIGENAYFVTDNDCADSAGAAASSAATAASVATRIGEVVALPTSTTVWVHLRSYSQIDS